MRDTIYHPLELLDPCFEDNHEDFLCDFVENAGILVFQALSVKDVVSGESSLDMTKKRSYLMRLQGCKPGAVSAGSFSREDIQRISLPCADVHT
jgi:hypothetical protein